jgi:hypothetical protein
VFNNVLDWYAQRIQDACSLTLMTLPFDVSPIILAGLDNAKRSLRLGISENEPTKEVRDAERRNKGMLAFSNGTFLGKTFAHIKSSAGGAKVAPIPQSKLDQGSLRKYWLGQ